MPKPGEPKPESSTAFEAVETTEVIPVEKLIPQKVAEPKPLEQKPDEAPSDAKTSAPEPRPVATKTIVMEPEREPAPEPEPEPESPDRKYVAPTVIPTHTIPDHAEDAPKIVLNIPEPKASGPAETRVAEVRARRRAPTVKIARGALGVSPSALGITPVRPMDEDIDVAMDDEPPPAVEPPPALAVLAAPLDVRGEHPRVELPPTETSVDSKPQRGRSWLAWTSALVLVGGGGLFAALVATGGIELGERAAATTTGSAAVATTSATARTTSPAPTALPPTASAVESAPPSATTSASAAASGPSRSAAPPVAQPPHTWPPAGHTAPRTWPPPKPTTTSTGRVNPTTI